jgi:hypothetical protein
MEKKGIIYEIVCNETGERYIGSTTNKLSNRISQHKIITKNMCCSRQIINRNNYCYNILETIIIKELRIKEREWYDKLDCINKQRPYRTDEERINESRIYTKLHYKDYNDKNIEEITLYKKNWYEKNKEKILEKRKNYYDNNKELINNKRRAYYQANKK